MTFRVVARVLQERSFLRTELRRQMTTVIGGSHDRWRVADPARLEVWVVEYQPGRLVAGLRLSDVTMRQRNGRAVERQGALRPAVAAAMVRAAGPTPAEAPAAGDEAAVLLDPCCGSGTVLSEALAVGWSAEGVDIDPDAVSAARANAPRAVAAAGDVHHLDRAAGSITAVVSNLPFGQQFQVQGGMRLWLTATLAEIARVTRPGGRVVLLAPDIPADAVPAGLRLVERHRLTLLGTRTTLWVYDRR